MSIIAVLAQPASMGGFQISTVWNYYDDQDPANAGVGLGRPPVVVLHTEVFTLSPTDTDVTVLKKRINDVGLAVQAANTAATGFNQAIPVGFPVVITQDG